MDARQKEKIHKRLISEKLELQSRKNAIQNKSREKIEKINRRLNSIADELLHLNQPSLPGI